MEKNITRILIWFISGDSQSSKSNVKRRVAVLVAFYPERPVFIDTIIDCIKDLFVNL